MRRRFVIFIVVSGAASLQPVRVGGGGGVRSLVRR